MEKQPLRLFNTLTKRKEVFIPLIDGRVGMYNCGPTVYDFVHIGNLRAYVFADILRRTLEWNGYAVRQIVNITDVGHLTSDADEGEDKMTKGLAREGLSLTLEAMKTLAERYTKSFEEDLAALNIKHPTVLPRASEHINEQIDLIKTLETKGLTYTTSDGVYFDTSKDRHYGKLGGLSSESVARVETNREKKHPRDFALWKFSSASDGQVELGWESPWGRGFPGWHIECSAMSMKYLGETFDIHTGGKEHVATHHNNEIAQSENATSSPLAHYWLHHEWVNLGKEKMAKSAGGFITRTILEEKGFDPLSYRYWLLTAHYRSLMDFTWEALEGAQNAFQKLKNRLLELGSDAGAPSPEYLKRFTVFLNDDLNTPQALALVWDLLKDEDVADADKKTTILEFDKVFGLGFDAVVPVAVPPDIEKLVAEREEARRHNNWQKADDLRQKINDLGFDVGDTETGTHVTKL